MKVRSDVNQRISAGTEIRAPEDGECRGGCRVDGQGSQQAVGGVEAGTQVLSAGGRPVLWRVQERAPVPVVPPPVLTVHMTSSVSIVLACFSTNSQQMLFFKTKSHSKARQIMQITWLLFRTILCQTKVFGLK